MDNRRGGGVGAQPSASDDIARVWTADDIAEHFEVSPVTVYRWRAQGDLPAPRDEESRPLTWDPQVIRAWADKWFLTHREPPDIKGIPWWGTEEIADYLGVERVTVHRYKSDGKLPEPARYYGRSPVWEPQTIIDWNAARPSGRWKARGGRPRRAEG